MKYIDRYRSVSAKVILILFFVLLLSFIIVVIYQHFSMSGSYISKEISRSRALTTFCEQVRLFVSKLRAQNTFDDDYMIRKMKQEMESGKKYYETDIYLTIPVVAAWTAAEAKAKELGYRFRTPRNNPRNPKNAPRPGVEQKIVDYLEGKGSLAEIEKAGAKIVYPPDKNQALQIGEIGVIHTGSEKFNRAEKGDSKKIDAVRFFRAIRLTEDCLVCHGDPKGESDLLGFEKEGWKAGEIHGAFEIISPLKDMRKDLAGARFHNILIALGIFIVSGLIFYYVLNRFVTRPIKKMVDFSKKLGKGDFRSSIGVENKDEIGEMATHFNGSVVNLRKTMKKIADTSHTLLFFSEELSEISGRMSDSSDRMREESEMVASAVEEVSSSTNTVASASEQSSRNISNIAAMTEEMSATVRNVAEFAGKTTEKVNRMSDYGREMVDSIEGVAAAIEEMNASMNEVSRNTSQASKISRDAIKRSEMITARMDALEDASRKIGKFVDVIKHIASQTNMLALNATIEAAGAGEAGKGFSVVASEVKELARQSADASDEVAGQVEDVQNSIREAMNAVKSVNEVIDEISGISEIIASAMEEQAAATGEIAKTIASNATMARDVSTFAGETSDLISDMSRSADQTADTAEETSKNVNEMSGAIGDIARSINEAARGVDEISKNIQNIRMVANDVSVGASVTSQSSRDIEKSSSKLSRIVASFDIGKEKFDIGKVKSSHLLWRSKLEGVLRGARTLRPEEVVSDHECEFGKWLDSPEGQIYKESPHYREIVKYHKEVHDHARNLVELHGNGKTAEAEQYMEKFERARENMFEHLELLYSDE